MIQARRQAKKIADTTLQGGKEGFMDERRKPLRYQRLEPIRYSSKAAVVLAIVGIVSVMPHIWPLISSLYQAQ